MTPYLIPELKPLVMRSMSPDGPVYDDMNFFSSRPPPDIDFAKLEARMVAVLARTRDPGVMLTSSEAGLWARRQNRLKTLADNVSRAANRCTVWRVVQCGDELVRVQATGKVGSRRWRRYRKWDNAWLKESARLPKLTRKATTDEWRRITDPIFHNAIASGLRNLRNARAAMNAAPAE